MGMSKDASYLYFASKEDLGGGATAGRSNLYLYHGGAFSFVATLAQVDLSSAVGTSPVGHVARVTPDGRHAAFMSAARPTGYDNVDANNGKAAGEVYLYDASANGGAGKLVCTSCNPTGARPVGAEIVEGGHVTGYWAAARIPVSESSLHAARMLSDDGKRLYFTSTDTLSPRDTNGAQDVYEWEQEGSGSCEEKDLSFAPASGGCLSLISSGKSPLAADFVDASPSVDDVFLSTASSLVTQDYGLIDIYDARVGGGFPPPPQPPAACEGEACQSPFAAPEDPTPASSAFKGAGNVVETPQGRCPKGKVRRRGRCTPRKHHKQAHKGKRASHHGRAGR
jgi:hypothetical protein